MTVKEFGFFEDPSHFVTPCHEDRLVHKQSVGSVKGAKSSITNATGKDLLTETTFLAVINWLNQDKDKYHNEINHGISFLNDQAKDFGAYGST